MHISTRLPPLAIPGTSPSATPPRRTWPTRLLLLTRTWRQRSRERGYLAIADHRLQTDLRATGQDAARELQKPVWR